MKLEHIVNNSSYHIPGCHISGHYYKLESWIRGFANINPVKPTLEVATIHRFALHNSRMHALLP